MSGKYSYYLLVNFTAKQFIYMHIPTFNLFKLLMAALLLMALPVLGQDKKPVPPVVPPGSTSPAVTGFPGAVKTGPKPYKDIITDKAVSKKGLFTVHKVEDKWYFEIADSLLGRDILIVNRLSKAAAGMRNFFFGYAGDQIGNNVVSFEKGPNNKIFLKKISFDELSKNRRQPMYRAVMNSNIQPIVAAFDIAAFSKDSTGSVIEMTNYINTDNDILNFAANLKTLFQVGGQQTDKSYIVSVKTYPLNVEIKTVKTYSKSSGGGFGVPTPLPFASTGGGQLLTMELNSSLVLLPKKTMQQRFFDPRVGFFQR